MASVLTHPEKELKVVGTSPVRPDGAPKVTGLAQYGADFSLPGMLWAGSCARRTPTPASGPSTLRKRRR